METDNNAAKTGSSKNRQQKKEKRKMPWDTAPGKKWLWMGISTALVLSLIYMSLYDFFQTRGESYGMESPAENTNNLQWLFQSNEILYRDLYNHNQKDKLSFWELYYATGNTINSSDNTLSDGNDTAVSDGDDTGSETVFDEANREMEEAAVMNNVTNYYSSLEDQFINLNSMYDYYIRNTKDGSYLTNTAAKDGLLPKDYFFYLTFCYDEYGNITLGEVVQGKHPDNLRRNASEVVRGESFGNYFRMKENGYFSELGLTPGMGSDINVIEVKSPVNCEITYGITNEMWEKLQNGSAEGYTRRYYWTLPNSFLVGGGDEFYHIFVFLTVLLGLFLPGAGEEKPWKRMKWLALPLELLCAIGLCIMVMDTNVVLMAEKVYSGNLAYNIAAALGIPGFKSIGYMIAFAANYLFLVLLFLGAWFLGISLRSIRDEGIRSYLKRQSLIYRFFPFLKGKVILGYDALVHFNLTKNSKKIIRRLVIVNAILLFIISCFWVGGIALTLVYSILLYFILSKYISNIQKKYSVLLGVTNEIAEGNLNVVIKEDLGVFEPFRPQVLRIQDGFKNAVEEEVKSQRMKAELITNVSHDLKTPLTAIITYINLLKDETLEEEKRQEYLNTLEKKSLRLKVLIEDLFEVSKANSKNVTLNLMDVDVINLIKQVELEMSDKMKAANLDVRMNLPDEKIILPLDSQKTYRIYENLLGNVAKYALPGTRVYISGFRLNDTVAITIKNITEQELSVNPDELTDRFVRGDSSRNTEGSGLGLSIAKSFMELQNGRLDIDIDGDLFKATTVFTLPASQ